MHYSSYHHIKIIILVYRSVSNYIIVALLKENYNNMQSCVILLMKITMICANTI